MTDWLADWLTYSPPPFNNTPPNPSQLENCSNNISKYNKVKQQTNKKLSNIQYIIPPPLDDGRDLPPPLTYHLPLITTYHQPKPLLRKLNSHYGVLLLLLLLLLYSKIFPPRPGSVPTTTVLYYCTYFLAHLSRSLHCNRSRP